MVLVEGLCREEARPVPAGVAGAATKIIFWLFARFKSPQVDSAPILCECILRGARLDRVVPAEAGSAGGAPVLRNPMAAADGVGPDAPPAWRNVFMLVVPLAAAWFARWLWRDGLSEYRQVGAWIASESNTKFPAVESKATTAKPRRD
jgi:hypothetical protein